MFKLVVNQKKYWNFIRELRNDSKVQSGFIDTLPEITEEQQHLYMKKYNDNYYICLEDDIPIGYIRQIDGDIGVCTHPDHWGKGAGSYMIDELMKLHPECYAKVKLNNIGSVKAFEKVGFKKKYYLMERD
jgi:RimJ/RimL family protein N-acetyltransferase